jgi:hypothetical protein
MHAGSTVMNKAARTRRRRDDILNQGKKHGESVLPPNKGTAVNGRVHEHVLANVDADVDVHMLVDVIGLFIVK